MLNHHHLDLRPETIQQEDLINLNIIQDILEEEISAYAIQNPENVYDQEEQRIMRQLEFSRGLKRHQMVVAPDGFIRWISKGFPSNLLMSVHNSLLGVEILDEDYPYSPLPVTVHDPSTSTHEPPIQDP